MNHLPFTINHKPPKGQAMIEFTFCMIILFLMMYAIVMVFRWTGRDLGRRQKAHEELLISSIDSRYGSCLAYDYVSSYGGYVQGNCLEYIDMTVGPLSQIDPYFYTPEPMNAVWNGN